MKKELIHQTNTRVRFSEVDSMGVVWHGNYIRYFEDGREAFGDHYGISYLDFYRQGILIPVVKVECDYKFILEYGDSITIETKFVNSEAAKILYEYRIFKNNKVVATGKSTQVFMNESRELMLNAPEFFLDWKKKNGLI
ncbi:MAG: acyl-CoA thioesterase [Bacteroidales bacterium]|nr:acyl-CoA thioesterase [Bacteroidales bacterium]